MSPSKKPSSIGQDTFGFDDSDNGGHPSQSTVAESGNDDAPLARSYQNWFLEYASYVILDRAVPAIGDGPIENDV